MESHVDLEEGVACHSREQLQVRTRPCRAACAQAVDLLRAVTKPMSGPYLLSSTGGSTPIQGIAKFFRTQLRTQIIADTGAAFSKHLTSHVLRRTVATRLVEFFG